MNIKVISKLLLIFFGIRIFSYFFTPVTALWAQSSINTIVTAAILCAAIYFIYKKNELGWLIVAGELILGGSGGYFQLFGLSLRTLLLLSSLFPFFVRKLSTEKKSFFQKFQTEHYLIFGLLTTAALAMIRGYFSGHAIHEIISDAIPYLFLLYFFPLQQLWQSAKFRTFCFNAISTSIIGNTLFVLGTQIGFSSGILVLQDHYYHWFRDVVLGKITDLNFNFYRIFLNEHLIVVPLILYFLADIIRRKINYTNSILLTCLLFILANNLSRIYLVGLAAGVLFLFSAKHWKRWLIASVSAALCFFFLFSLTHLVASRGQSFGMELFGVRVQSIVAPGIEDSSLSRLVLLPKILEKIKSHPIIGVGFGDTLTILSPVYKTTITTTQYDWGYLEIWSEMGLYGLVMWVVLLGFIIFRLLKYKKENYQTYLAILIGFSVLNVTGPALFHVLGVVLVVWIAEISCERNLQKTLAV